MKRRLIHLLVVAGTLVASTGCAQHAGHDFWARTREHLEWHVIGIDETTDKLHRILDVHLLGHNPRDPDTY